MKDNSGSNHARIGRAQSMRPTRNFEDDYSLNCTTQGPVTNNNNNRVYNKFQNWQSL